MAAEGSDQTGFAEFIADFVKRLDHAAGVSGEGVAGAEDALADFAIPFFENAEDGSAGVSRRVFLLGSKGAGRWHRDWTYHSHVCPGDYLHELWRSGIMAAKLRPPKAAHV